MIIRLQYEDNEQRQRIIAENSEKFLLGEQIFDEGNFLLFGDEEDRPFDPNVEIVQIKTEIQKLITSDLDNKEMLNGIAAVVFGG